MLTNRNVQRKNTLTHSSNLGAVLLQRRRRPCRHQQVSHVLVLAAVLAIVLACEEGTEANGGDLLLPQQHTHTSRDTRGRVTYFVLPIGSANFHSAFPPHTRVHVTLYHTQLQHIQHTHTTTTTPQQRVCTCGTRPRACKDTFQDTFQDTCQDTYLRLQGPTPGGRTCSPAAICSSSRAVLCRRARRRASISSAVLPEAQTMKMWPYLWRGKEGGRKVEGRGHKGGKQWERGLGKKTEKTESRGEGTREVKRETRRDIERRGR